MQRWVLGTWFLGCYGEEEEEGEDEEVKGSQRKRLAER